MSLRTSSSLMSLLFRQNMLIIKFCYNISQPDFKSDTIQKYYFRVITMNELGKHYSIMKNKQI